MDKKRILELLAETINFDVDKLAAYDENQSLQDIGLESLMFVQFIVNIELEFGIEVNDEDLIMSKFFSLSDLYQTLEKYFNVAKISKKVLILDCDNVLWNGIVGEEEISIDKSFVNFHLELLALQRQGVLLCICSKNNMPNILNAFCDLEISVTWGDIICAKTSVSNKARSISDISNELNLSLDSFVFIDDSDYELGLVNAFLPEVRTLKAKQYNQEFFDELNLLFESGIISTMNRTQLYHDQKEREKEKRIFNSIEEYNLSLQTEYLCDLAVKSQSDRISELSFRTNQFNLSDTRYTCDEITDFMCNKDFQVFTLQVKDKYGDMGIVGAAIVRETLDKYVIESFWLSCRAFDRGFEDIMLETIRKYAGIKILYGVYAETNKNKKQASFYPQKGVYLYLDK